jgi:23S rRNA (adenine2030-N6)-methyltransferase
MNYRHHYHAGNKADIIKHILLIGLVQTLQRKETGCIYMDTHSGIGLYDLSAEESQKTGEAQEGICSIWNQLHSLTIQTLESIPWIQHYMNVLLRTQHCSSSSHQIPNLVYQSLRYYPGSPTLFHSMKRPQDRLILCEKHPKDVTYLKNHYQPYNNIMVHHRDGYEAIRALLPTKEKRGLVFIDPPFEQKDEWENMYDAIAYLTYHASTLTIAFWYPLKNMMLVENLWHKIQQQSWRNISRIEWQWSNQQHEFHGMGLGIIHTPWQWTDEALQHLKWLQRTFFPTHSCKGTQYNI